VIFALGLEPRRLRRRVPSELARVAARAVRTAAPRVLDARDWRALVEVEALAPLSDGDTVATEAFARLVDLCLGWMAREAAPRTASVAFVAAIAFTGLVPIGERKLLAQRLEGLGDEKALDPMARGLGVALARGAPGIDARLPRALSDVLDRVERV
jgi:hypothetical protein